MHPPPIPIRTARYHPLSSSLVIILVIISRYHPSLSSLVIIFVIFLRYHLSLSSLVIIPRYHPSLSSLVIIRCYHLSLSSFVIFLRYHLSLSSLVIILVIISRYHPRYHLSLSSPVILPGCVPFDGTSSASHEHTHQCPFEMSHPSNESPSIKILGTSIMICAGDRCILHVGSYFNSAEEFRQRRIVESAVLKH